MQFALRTSVAPDAVRRAIQGAIAQVDKDQPVGGTLTLDEFLSRTLARRRFGVTLLTSFGVIAVTLAAVGLYGVLAVIVGERRREIGVRMALGARPRDIATDLLGEGLRLAGVGVVGGIALALAATRLLNALLFGTSPTDALTFVSAAALIVTVAACASFHPRPACQPRRSPRRAQRRVARPSTRSGRATLGGMKRQESRRVDRSRINRPSI